MAAVELASRRWRTVRARATLDRRWPVCCGQELVDVGRDGLVEVVLLAVELERDGDRVPVGEEPLAVAGP